MKRIKVLLNKIRMDVGRYCHREAGVFEEKNLEALMNSLTAEGLQVPIEGYVDKEGYFVVIKGHRRVKALLLLAAKNIPGFTVDMDVEAIELGNYTPEDLMVRSIVDNERRRLLTRDERIN
jgi:ParB-like chromosome segregation protein Spo0J